MRLIDAGISRLTLKEGLCDMASTEFCFAQKDCYTCPHGRKCFKRLAAYEDTGLTPEEITALKADNERLHRLLDQAEEIVQPTLNAPKNRDSVYCKDCDYLNTDGSRPYCCHSNMSTNGLDDWCYHGVKRKESDNNA